NDRPLPKVAGRHRVSGPGAVRDGRPRRPGLDRVRERRQDWARRGGQSRPPDTGTDHQPRPAGRGPARGRGAGGPGGDRPLVVADDRREGGATALVLLAPAGRVVEKTPVTVGG